MAAPSQIGDQVGAYSVQVANNGFVDILSALTGTQEVIVQNIFSGGQISLTWFDGTHEFIFFTSTSSQIADLEGKTYRGSLNSNLRIRIKNVSGGAIDIGWSGVLSHT